MTTIGKALGQEYATVVAIGDSITAVNHWTLGGLNWVGLLQCNLGTCFRQGYTVINSGIGGDWITGGLARLERDVLRFTPQLTIISFGMNDASAPERLGEFTENLRSMVRQVRATGSRVLLRTPNPIISMADGTELHEQCINGNTYRYAVGEYAAAIMQVATEEQVWAVDHYTLWQQSLASRYHGEMCMLMGNCVHPNANGHRRFFHELAPIFGMEPTFQHEWQHILEMQ
ncbi:MAG TPA: SGNH/GDSL hydrolase family protein [Armatimonadota bacterium]|jgi:lysophospholipase L1-like esterase